MAKSNLWRKAFVSSYTPRRQLITVGSQGRNSRQNLEARIDE